MLKVLLVTFLTDLGLNSFFENIDGNFLYKEPDLNSHLHQYIDISIDNEGEITGYVFKIEKNCVWVKISKSDMKDIYINDTIVFNTKELWLFKVKID